MQLSISDFIGALGVAILLLAFLLNLLNKVSKDSVVYIVLNIVGSGLACIASWLISYIPFVILEAAWMLISTIALINFYRRS